MTDSPAFRAPIAPGEQPILDALLVVRDKLLLLKQDKTKYVKSADVSGIYEELIGHVEKLNQIRTNRRGEQNRLDGVLDDCLQLISLFFMTVGRTNEAPAAYSLVSNIKRLLDHLKEAAFYTQRDCAGVSRNLKVIEETIERGRDKHSQAILTLLEARIAACRVVLTELQNVLNQLSPELHADNEILVSVLRTLSGANTRSKFPTGEVDELLKKIKEVAAKFEGPPPQLPDPSLTIDERLQMYADKLSNISYEQAAHLPGAQIIKELLERCMLWAEISCRRRGKIAPNFKDTFDQLVVIRNQLEKLSLTQAWSLRETDLYSFQRKLDRIDESRVDGHFVDGHGNMADLFEQRTLLYLLRKSYATIYNMLTSSEPVSEALQPVYNQLTTLRRCLVEVKRSGGVSSARELYPYSMKLNSIDNMRHDGKFVVNGDVPEGQGTVIALLSECFEMAYELRNEAEEESDNETRSNAEAEEEEEEEEEPLVELRTQDRRIDYPGQNESTVGLMPVMSRT